MSNDRFTAVGVNIAEKATMIWNVADLLRGPFKPHEYGLVILPMTVVKRFHDCLLPTHQAVLDQYEKVKKLAADLGIHKVRVVANKVRNAEDEAFLKSRIPEDALLGMIHYNADVIEADRRGLSPFDMSQKAVEEIRAIKNRIDDEKK